MARNAKIIKLAVGLGGIVIVLLAEALIPGVGSPGQKDIAALQGVLHGVELKPAIVNGLVRDLLMTLMAIVGVMGLMDVFAKRRLDPQPTPN
jgi:hypothetical protein